MWRTGSKRNKIFTASLVKTIFEAKETAASDILAYRNYMNKTWLCKRTCNRLPKHQLGIIRLMSPQLPRKSESKHVRTDKTTIEKTKVEINLLWGTDLIDIWRFSKLYASHLKIFPHCCFLPSSYASRFICQLWRVFLSTPPSLKVQTTEEPSLLWNYLIGPRIIYLQGLFGEAKTAHQPAASEGWGGGPSTTNCHWHSVYEPSKGIRAFPWETRSGQTRAEYFLTS